MFLDEKLLQICIDTEINSGEDVQNLNTILCTECEEALKGYIDLTKPKKRKLKFFLDCVS